MQFEFRHVTPLEVDARSILVLMEALIEYRRYFAHGVRFYAVSHDCNVDYSSRRNASMVLMYSSERADFNKSQWQSPSRGFNRAPGISAARSTLF